MLAPPAGLSIQAAGGIPFARTNLPDMGLRIHTDSALYGLTRNLSEEVRMAQRVAALGLNYYDIGRQTGKVVVRILNGEAPGKIASQTSTTFELHLNLAAAQKHGATLPDELVKSAKVVLR